MASTSWLLVIRWLFCNRVAADADESGPLLRSRDGAELGLASPLARLIDASQGNFAVEGSCATDINGLLGSSSLFGKG